MALLWIACDSLVFFLKKKKIPPAFTEKVYYDSFRWIKILCSQT